MTRCDRRRGRSRYVTAGGLSLLAASWIAGCRDGKEPKHPPQPLGGCFDICTASGTTPPNDWNAYCGSSDADKQARRKCAKNSVCGRAPCSGCCSQWTAACVAAIPNLCSNVTCSSYGPGPACYP